MSFQLLKSDGPDSSGGRPTEDLVNLKTLFPHIKAYGFLSPEDQPPTPDAPNSVLAGQMARKVYVRNNYNRLIRNCKIFFSKPPVDCYMEMALGDEVDTVPPDLDSHFNFYNSQDNSLFIGNMKPGEVRAVWIHLCWEDNAGSPDVIPFSIDVTGDTGATSFSLQFEMDIYYIPMPVDMGNFFTSTLKDMFIIFLKNFFYNFFDKSYRWSPIERNSKILISDRLVYNLEQPEFRPTIIVVRGTLGYQDMVLDDLQTKDLPTDDSTFTDMVSGPMVLQCIDREDIPAEYLGEIAFKAVKRFRLILKRAGLHNIKRLTLGESIMIGGDSRPEAHMVPVQMQVFFQDRWGTSLLHKHLLKRVEYDINLNHKICQSAD